jgi:predicted nucleotidyltransferase
MVIIPGVEIREARLAAICDKYGIAELKVFGSRARGTDRADSDIDVLYTLRPGRRLGWEIAQLSEELAELFGHAVDLVSLRALHPLLQSQCWPRPGRSMRRDILLLTEMIDAAEQAQQLARGITVSQLEADRQRRDALLWSFTVLGEVDRVAPSPTNGTS